MKFGSGWVIIIMDFFFELSLDLCWYDLISSHNTNIKQNLFLTYLWSSFRSCHLNFHYCYVLYIAYVIILPSLEQIHSTVTFHTSKEASLALSFQCDEEILFNYLKCSFLWGEKDQTQPIFQVYTSPGF